MDVTGRVALNTGGSRGLGFAVARALLRRGCRVVVCARDPEELAALPHLRRARGRVVTIT